MNYFIFFNLKKESFYFFILYFSLCRSYNSSFRAFHCSIMRLSHFYACCYKLSTYKYLILKLEKKLDLEVGVNF